MKIQIALSAAGDWKVPDNADLVLEYKYEYELPSRNWPSRCRTIGAEYPIFKDEKDFIRKVKAAEIIDLTDNIRVNNMTRCSTIAEVEDMVSQYQFPRDVKRIQQGFKDGVTMPLPIIIRGSKGMWILSGNTRQSIARIMKVPRKAIVVDA